jgi:RHS repeat-associated protein
MNFAPKLKSTLIAFIILLSFSDVFAQIHPQISCVANSINPTTLYPSEGAGQVTPTVVVATSNNCTTYTISNNNSWITYSKNGLNVTISVQANTGPSRYGTLSIGGQTLTVFQSCGNFPVKPTSISVDRNNLCANSGGNIILTAVGGSGTNTRWFSGSCGGTFVGLSDAASISIAAPTTTTTYSGLWETSCGSSMCKSITVTVNPLPVLSINGTLSVCTGSTYTYTTNSGLTGYIWTLPSGASGSSTTNSINVTIGTSSGTVSVSAVDGNGCRSNPATLGVTISTLTTYNVTGGGTTCPGIPIAVGLYGTTSGITYKCYLNGSPVSSPIAGTGGPISWNQSSGGTYTITGVTSGGCEVPMIGIAVITLQSVSVAPISITATLPSPCLGQSTRLTVNGGSLGTGAFWHWHSGNDPCGSADAGTGTNITVTPSVTTTYYVGAEGGCSPTSCVHITVTVISPPVITSQPVNPTITLGQDASFSVTATGSNLSFQWQSSLDGVTWTNLTGLPAVGYQTPNLTIKGSTTFEDNFYRCMIFNSCGSITYSNNVKIVLFYPGTSYLSGTDIPDPETRTLNTSYLVGATTGSFNINPMGGSSYTIPIVTPPGVNGLSPNLSLEYSSNGASGIPGFGWQIGGLSTISLGANRRMDWDFNNREINDRFYLDGQRLQPNTTSPGYGDPNTKYETENDIFTQVTPEATDPTYGPTWFMAQTKSGLIYEYGNSQSSRQRLDLNSRIMNWYISKISDLFGNQINFAYIQDHFSVYPSEITYGPNTISFSYKLRSDGSPSLINGKRIEQWLLLDKIVIKYNSNVVKTYEFKQSYQGSNYNSNSILNELIEYGIGSSRVNSTAFSYLVPENLAFTQTTSNNTTYADITYKSRLISGDFNGDGKADFLCLPDPSKGSTWSGMKVYFGDGADNFINPFTSSTSLDLTKLRDIRTMDLNGDGIDDILYEYPNASDQNKSDFYYIICNGSSLSQPVFITTLAFNSNTGMTGKFRRNGSSQEDDNERSRMQIGKNSFSPINPLKTKSIVDSDIDGDGINDVFLNDPNSHCQIWSLKNGVMTNLLDLTYLAGFLNSDVLTGDFNGDGMIDIWSLNNTGINIYTYDIPTKTIINIYSASLPTNQHFFTLGDFNGDGKEDIFIYGYKDNDGVEHDWSNWQIRLSTGSGIEEHDVYQKKANLKNDYVRTGDFNGDGSNDIMVTSKNLSWQGAYFYTSMSNGTDFSTYNIIGYPYSTNNFYLADFNGDGCTEFMCTSGLNSWDGYQIWSGYQVNKPQRNTSILMNKVANGLGFLTKMSYTTLSQATSTVYVRDKIAAFPVMDFQGPWSVVSSVQVDNGKGSMNTQNYFYEGAKIHLQGKGFLGYAKTSMTDVTSGITSESTSGYDMTFFYPTLLKTKTKIAATGEIVSTVTNQWSRLNLEPYQRIYFAYIKGSSQLNKLTGDSITTSAHYDYEGNPTSVVKSFSNGSTERDTTNFENLDTNNKWLLGRPISTTIIFTGSSPAITRSATRVFDSNSNHLTSETWYAGANNQIKKDYTYYSNGNLQTLTATANGKTRSNSYTYEADNIRIHSTTDQLSHTTTNSFDSYGRLSTQLDYLGTNTMTYQYDNFNRQSSAALNSNEKVTTTTYVWESDPTSPRYSVQVTGNDGSQSQTWYDKIGREVKSGKKGFSGNMIYISTVYNTKGQVESVSEPSFSTGSLNTFTYDPYGRKISLTRPSGKNSTWSYNYEIVTEITGGRTFTKTYSSDGTISVATDPGGTLNYFYYNDGKVKSITAPGGTTSMQYDIAGNQNLLTDPSAGTTTYTYNGFGELTDQQNARAQTTHLDYLDDGRLNSKALSLEGTSNYSYNGNKQLTGISSPGSVSRSLAYDTEGRLISSTETIPGSSAFITALSYDDKGRIRSITNPSNIIEKKHYNLYGYLDSISSQGVVRWQIATVNERQQITSANYWQSGSTLSSTFGYDPNGYPTSTIAGTVQNYAYIFDPITGNLTSRQNKNYTGLTENFHYDNLDRLDDANIGTTMTLDMVYDSNGRMTTKSDVGTFSYNTPNKPYAVSNINPSTSLTPNNPQTITYTSFASVKTISENNYNAAFLYNCDNQRAQMNVMQGSNTIMTRWYPSDNYIKETAGGVTKEYTFIGGDSYTAPIVAITQSGTTTYYDILRDYLGNITHVINATTKAVTAEYSFDAWGRMRIPSTWAYYAPGSEPALFIAGRGFTGHEHLPWFNLINMNGRLYDALVGQFLSPDNFIQNPGSTQNFNRYAYCLNNPLKYSDPSGMMAKARDEEGDAAFDAYFYWLCDGSMSFGNMAGGGGGGGASIDGAAGWNRNASIEGMLGYRRVNGKYYDRATDEIAPWSKVYNHYFNNDIKHGTFYMPYCPLPIYYQTTSGGTVLAIQWVEKDTKHNAEMLWMHLWYSDKSGLTDFTYLQTINTNDLGDGQTESPYIDRENDSGPFYYNSGDNREFIDNPTRPIKNGTFWSGELSVVGYGGLFNPKIVQTLNWGYIFIQNTLFPFQTLPTYPTDYHRESLHWHLKY